MDSDLLRLGFVILAVWGAVSLTALTIYGLWRLALWFMDKDELEA